MVQAGQAGWQQEQCCPGAGGAMSWLDAAPAWAACGQQHSPLHQPSVISSFNYYTLMKVF